MITNAGPVMNAETMKRGASSAEFQNGRPPRPEYKNAVTVWMEMAQPFHLVRFPANNRNHHILRQEFGSPK